MPELRKPIPWAKMVFVAAFVVACGAAVTPLVLTEQAANPPVATPPSSGLPGWVLNPATLPAAFVGKNNCTFEFGLPVPKWNYLPGAGCWESAGPDGWTRQQFQDIYSPTAPICNGGPVSVTAIRVCRAGFAGQVSPCNGATTGPHGCAVCVVNPQCL